MQPFHGIATLLLLICLLGGCTEDIPILDGTWTGTGWFHAIGSNQDTLDVVFAGDSLWYRGVVVPSTVSHGKGTFRVSVNSLRIKTMRTDSEYHTTSGNETSSTHEYTYSDGTLETMWFTIHRVSDSKELPK